MFAAVNRLTQCRGLLALVYMLTCLDAPANAAEFNAYAGPNVYGPETTVASHLGSVTLTISYQALGKTSVTGVVTYFKNADDDHPTEEAFVGSTTIRTADVVGNVVVKFRGTPFGSAVKLTVN